MLKQAERKITALPVRGNNTFPIKSYSTRREIFGLPRLDGLQIESYDWFLQKGLKELFEEMSPVEDLTGKNYELYFLDYYLEEPRLTEKEAREMDTTYTASLRCKLRLVNKQTGESKEQEVFLGDLPLMTRSGTFIINGVERVVVSQLVRSSGVLFSREEGLKYGVYGAKIIPDRGAWLEIETNSRGIMTVKIDRKRKTYLTTFLRAFGNGTDEEILKLFSDVDTDSDVNCLKATLEKDPSKSHEEALLEFYRKVRPGDLTTVDNAKSLFLNMFTNFRRYDLGGVGRYKLNKRLGLNAPDDKEHRVLTKEDFETIAREVMRLNNQGGDADDVDDLKNRRVRAVGELIQSRFRTGLLRVERIIKDRMSVIDAETITPAQLVNARPISAVLQEFFGSSRLSQFMDQNNPLAELEHKRRLSAMGPGGLSRERAGLEVRDVHSSHYGRICPIATPEGQNIGLVGHLAAYARVNEYGFLETPYRRVIKTVKNDGKSPLGYIIYKNVLHPKSKKLLAKAGEKVDETLAKKLAVYAKDIPIIDIKASLTNEIDYLDAYTESKVTIGQAKVPVDEYGVILSKRLLARRGGEPLTASIGDIDYVDASPQQILSLATSLIPFVEHDDAKRALMGTNMQRQAVPLVKPQVPLVGTGMEKEAALGSGWVITAPQEGVVSYVDAERIELTCGRKKFNFELINFSRSNAETNLHQKPIVEQGQKVKKGEVLADGPATVGGRLALGSNLVVAFMPWEGENYEDAVLISERLVKEDIYTSVHIKRKEIDVRDTKLGPEITTRDIPNVGEEAIADLDEEGIIRIGARVKGGSILIGKITPKGETELTSEEKLLRAIFGEKIKDVKDTSLRMPHGGYGKVIGVKIFDREKGDKLEVGVIKRIYVYIAQLRKISVGDKLSGRHGNKGVIARILPEADMPFMADGTPVDIVLNPLGVISRMNIGQILESHLGIAAARLGFNAAAPLFEDMKVDDIVKELKEAGFDASGKVQLYDGRTGEPFEQKTMLGVIYMMKLIHMVDDKIHARSIGPYALVTQQPLGGKAQHGGQRLGEMEVWALEGYGAAHTLQEMLTIKSDDVAGRSRAYESIIKGEEIQKPQTPEAFNVIVKELEGLCLNIELLSPEVLKKYEK